jgi:hypothetical protein
MAAWNVRGQDLKGAIENLATDAARAYVRPVVSGFGSDLNTGWFHRAPKAQKLGFNVEVGFVAMGTLFNKKDKRFSVTKDLMITGDEATRLATTFVENDPTLSQLTGTFKDQAIATIANEIADQVVNVTIAGATFIGNKEDSVKLTINNDIIFTYNSQSYTMQNGQETNLGVGGLLDAPVVPLLAPQLTLGTVMGSQLTVRYVPTVKLRDEVGKVQYFGIGIQHNPGVWFPQPLPVDLAVAFYTQNLKQGKLFEATATAYGITASKQFGFRFLNLTPYAGFLLESSEMKFRYDYSYEVPDGTGGLTTETAQIKFTEKGKNKNRITIGTNVRFLMVNINADYSFARNSAYSAGINFAL